MRPLSFDLHLVVSRHPRAYALISPPTRLHQRAAPEPQVEVWAFTRGAEAELLLNGQSLGRVAVPTFGHASWPAVPYAPGTLECRAYAKVCARLAVSRSVSLSVRERSVGWSVDLIMACTQSTCRQISLPRAFFVLFAGGALTRDHALVPLSPPFKAGDADFRSSVTTETTGAPAALVLTIKDGVGSTGLADDGSAVALVTATVVDAEGRTVPQHGELEITFTVTDADGQWLLTVRWLSWSL